MNHLMPSQYGVLKVTAACCLNNYRATKKDRFLLLAMEYIAAALKLHRISKP